MKDIVVSTITEGSMAPTLEIKSRYALVEEGFFPESQYLTFNDLLFSVALANRFASDCNIPISVTTHKDLFIWQLQVFERDYMAYTKYVKLCDVIKEKYNGNIDEWLAYYSKVRNQIIEDLENNEYYKLFNNRFELMYEQRYSFPNGNVYTEDNIKGQVFLSVDLKSANFQALRWVDKRIVRNSDSYKDFIRLYTDDEYILESKYTRQVIFGKVNPKRQMRVERIIIENVFERLMDNFGLKDMIVGTPKMCNDEFIIELNKDKIPSEETLLKMVTFIKETMDVNISTEVFTLNLFDIFVGAVDEYDTMAPHHRDTFFAKTNFYDKSKVKYKALPSRFATLAHLIKNNGVDILEEDIENSKYFVAEKILSKMVQDIIIKERI